MRRGRAALAAPAAATAALVWLMCSCLWSEVSAAREAAAHAASSSPLDVFFAARGNSASHSVTASNTASSNIQQPATLPNGDVPTVHSVRSLNIQNKALSGSSHFKDTPIGVNLEEPVVSRTRRSAPIPLSPTCGGVLRERAGVIQTPGFPRPFSVPLRCRWIIDASALNISTQNVSIVVYLTQLYVTTGLTFTEYAYYDGAFHVGEVLMHAVTEQNVTLVEWLWSRRPAVVVDFVLDRLEGNHLRVLDQLLDVYGFNITYEISGRPDPVRRAPCNVMTCSFVGDCFASADFTHYGCSCFEGFSGADCGQGPLCRPGRNVCHNGATCRHVGSAVVACNCTPGFTGSRCEIPLPESDIGGGECGENGCITQCAYDHGDPHSTACNCGRGFPVPTDRVRYEGTIRLANLSAWLDASRAAPAPPQPPPAPPQASTAASAAGIAAPPALVNTLEKLITKYLRSYNISKMDELRILKISAGGEVRFHFLGGRRDGARVREALARLVERGRLGNASLVPTQLAFRQEPTLLLKSVSVNHRDNVVHEGDEFILSCVAQGSARTAFQWYKDGALVNASRALGGRVWTWLARADAQDEYSALLRVTHASALDEGRYTCQVADWGVQQCRSLRLQVRTKPQVRLMPMSVTLERGEDVKIRCMSPNDQRLEKFGFNWTKNKALFRMRPGSEVWEDLNPSGSILKIHNAQKSAEYTCMVQGRLAQRSASVRVDVVNSSLVPLCPAEAALGVAWARAAPAQDAVAECPASRQGLARRACRLRDARRAAWARPDFSDCVAAPLRAIREKFQSLTLGFEMTTGTATLHALKNHLYWVISHNQLLPGEGEMVIELLAEVQNYLNITSAGREILNSTEMFFHIVSLLLGVQHSIINQERIIQLQDLVKAQTLLWGKQLTVPGAAHTNYSSIAVYVATLDSSVSHKLHFPTHSVSVPVWVTERIDICTDSASRQVLGNGSFSIAVIIYKNFSQFLPLRYAAKLKNDVELEYELNSRIVTIELGINGRKIEPPIGTFWVDLELDHLIHDYNPDEWNVSCGVASSVTFEHSWQLEGCIAQTTGLNTTRCRCYQTGTYAVLLTTQPLKPPSDPPGHYHMIVVVGCTCCLVQTVITLLVLLPYWWHHRNCLIFLKLQCCTATTGAMGIFIYAVRDTIPKNSFPYVTTSLEAFLLIGMSSHLSKLLIVYTEVVQIPKVRHIKQTVVSIITGVPVLAILCNHLAHHSTGWKLSSWWLVCGTMIFNIFVASAIIMLLLFVFLYCSVMRKLHILSGKNTDSNKAIKRRVGLLQRAGIIFGVMVVMEASSILYINVPHSTCHYIFSFTSALLGFIIFLCYILKSEAPIHTHVLRKLKLDTTPDDDFSSESANSPLRFFTKQDGDAESEGPPPRPSSALSRRGSRGTAEGQQGGLASGDEEADGDPSEGLLLVETGRSYRWTPPSDGAPSTVETYVHSADGSAEECGVSLKMRRTVQGNDSAVSKAEDVDLEHYHNSPRKFQQGATMTGNPQNYSEYVEKEELTPVPSNDQWKFVRGYRALPIPVPRPEPAQCYIRDSTTPPLLPQQQEIMTTRVCVELGVITSQMGEQGTNDDGSASSGAPAIVLCNVDVEPCHRSLLELTEVTATVETCHNRNPHTAIASIALTDDNCPAELVVTENNKVLLNDKEKVSPSTPESGRDSTPDPAISTNEEVKEQSSPSAPAAEKSTPKRNVDGTADEDNMEGMLDRISHDLDYLLNRKPHVSNGNVLATPSFSRKTSKPPSTAIQSQIKEEEEEEDEEVVHQ